MSNDFINDLLEALSFSPNNIPLRFRIAKSYFDKSDYVNAEKQYLEILELEQNNNKAKFGLANTYYKLEKISASEIILSIKC